MDLHWHSSGSLPGSFPALSHTSGNCPLFNSTSVTQPESGLQTLTGTRGCLNPSLSEPPCKVGHHSTCLFQRPSLCQGGPVDGERDRKLEVERKTGTGRDRDREEPGTAGRGPSGVLLRASCSSVHQPTPPKLRASPGFLPCGTWHPAERRWVGGCPGAYRVGTKRILWE